MFSAILLYCDIVMQINYYYYLHFSAALFVNSVISQIAQRPGRQLLVYVYCTCCQAQTFHYRVVQKKMHKVCAIILRPFAVESRGLQKIPSKDYS